MIAGALITLAALAAQTVVKAAATDGWEAAKRGFARLLGRGNPQQEQLAEQRLERTREQLTDAAGTDLEQARTTLVTQWTGRLTDLLEEAPDLEADLRALVQRIQAELPAEMVSAADHSFAAGQDVNISATTGGFAAGVFHGDLKLPNPSGPDPADT